MTTTLAAPKRLRARPAFNGFSTDEDDIVDFRTASSDDDDDNHSNENTIHMSEMKNKPQQKKFRIMQKQLPKDFSDDDMDSMMDEDEYKELFRMDYKTIFTDVINSEDHKKVVGEFLKLSGEDQEKHLKGHENHHSHPKFDISNPSVRFGRIDSQIRMAIRRHDTSFIEKLESELLPFIQASADEAVSMVFHFHDAFTRFIAHGICEYYLLNSKSVDLGSERVTLVSKPASMNIAVPKQTLSNFLQVTYSQLPGANVQSSQEFFKIIPPQQFKEQYKPMKKKKFHKKKSN